MVLSSCPRRRLRFREGEEVLDLHATSGMFDRSADRIAFAMRRGMITENPCRLLTRDDRPIPQERKVHHVWSDAEMTKLIEAAEHRDSQPESRYGEYAPLIRTAKARPG